MLNSIVLQGRLVRDAELRYTTSEKAVATFTLAVDRGGRDAGADFITCVAWEKTAQFIDQYFKKGDMCLVQGKLQSRSYEDKNGNKRTAFEVLVGNVNFCGGKKEQTTDAKPVFEDLGSSEDDWPF